MKKQHQYKFTEKQNSIKKEINDISENRIPIIILIDGLKDIGNIGMIFRLADAIRVEKVLFCNMDKKINEKLLYKKSRATSKYVKFEYCFNIAEIKALKNKYSLILLEKTNTSINYRSYIPEKAVCLVIGSEKLGVSQELMDISDHALHIPVEGINTSVNVATASAVVLYELYGHFNRL